MAGLLAYSSVIRLLFLGTLYHSPTLFSFSFISSLLLFSFFNIIYIRSGDNTVKIWDLNVGACVRTIDGHKKFVSALQVRTLLIDSIYIYIMLHFLSFFLLLLMFSYSY